MAVKSVRYVLDADVCDCVCALVLMNLSGLRAGGDVTADRLPAGLLRAPTVGVPSLQHLHTPSFASPLFSQSSAPHICCVLATDSKLQPPGPQPDSIPISLHVPLLTSSPQPTINSPSLCPSLPPTFSLILICFSLPTSVIFVLALQLLQPLSDFTPFPVFLSLLL